MEILDIHFSLRDLHFSTNEYLCFMSKISSLMKEKKVAARFLQRVKDPSAPLIGSPEAKVEAVKLSKNNNKNGSPGKEVNEENTGSSAISYEVGASVIFSILNTIV